MQLDSLSIVSTIGLEYLTATAMHDCGEFFFNVRVKGFQLGSQWVEIGTLLQELEANFLELKTALSVYSIIYWTYC